MKNRINQLCNKTGMSGSELGRRLGLQPHTIRRYLRNETQPKPELASQIAEIFGCSIEHVVGSGQDEAPNFGHIALYGAAQGGIGADITDMQQVIDHVERPSLLRSSPSAYAVICAGESMEPRYFAGDILFCNPSRSYRKYDFVVVQTIQDQKLYAQVKRYISADDSHVTFQQLNPDSYFQIDKHNITAVHFIAGSFTT